MTVPSSHAIEWNIRHALVAAEDQISEDAYSAMMGEVDALTSERHPDPNSYVMRDPEQFYTGRTDGTGESAEHDSLAEAEAWIAEREKVDPEGVKAGAYFIDAPETGGDA